MRQSTHHGEELGASATIMWPTTSKCSACSHVGARTQLPRLLMACFPTCCKPPRQRELLAGAGAFSLPPPHCLPLRRGGAHGCRPSLLRRRRCRHWRRVGRSEAEADVDDSIKQDLLWSWQHLLAAIAETGGSGAGAPANAGSPARLARRAPAQGQAPARHTLMNGQANPNLAFISLPLPQWRAAAARARQPPQTLGDL